MTTTQARAADWRQKADEAIARARYAAEEATEIEKQLAKSGSFVVQGCESLSIVLKHELDGHIRIWLERKLAERLETLQKIGV